MWADALSWTRCSTTSSFFSYCFTHTVQSYKLLFFIDRTNFWQELAMNYTIVIEENSEWNRHIWQNLLCFFRSWLFWPLVLGWMDFGFDINIISSDCVTSYHPFEQIWVIVDILQPRVCDAHATIPLSKIYHIRKKLPCYTYPKAPQKIEWCGPTDIPKS